MSKWQFAKDRLLYGLTAGNRHGLHSPFVYKLVDKVIYDYKPKKVYDDIENYRKQLLHDDIEIAVTCPGVQIDKRAKISQVAKIGLKPKLEQMLYRLVADLQPSTLIELGTGLGITTLYLHAAATDTKIYTLENRPQIAAVAQKGFNKAEVTGIQLITGNYDDTLPRLISELEQIDLVFINGNLQQQAVLNYFNWCLPKVHENTLLIFAGIYKNEGMKQAWAKIKAYPDVTVTVDLFWIGLVYFKKGRAKNDFKIKI